MDEGSPNVYPANWMKDHAIIYVPSDTPEAMALAPRKVAGVPLIVRGMMTLAQAGIESCTLIIAASQRERIEQFLSRFREDRLPEIHIVPYDEPYRVSPDMVEKIAENLSSRALLINANLLFDKNLIHTIYEHDPQTDELLLCKEGVHPLPIMEVTKEAWRDLSQFTVQSPRSIQSCIGYLIENFPHREIQKPPRVGAFLLKRREDIPVAEKFLAEDIRHSTSGFIAKHINKRFSLPVSTILAKMWISPHAVTCINIVIGLLSGVFLAGRGYTSMLIGASLFQLASIADGVDGEIAKLTFRSSKFGQYIDTISDNFALASLLVGLTIGSYRTLDSYSVFVAGGIAIAGIAIIIMSMARFLRRNTNSASLVTFDKEYLQKQSSGDHPIIMTFLRYCKHFAKKDIFSFMVFGLAVAGLIQYWIFWVAFGAVLGALSLTYLEISDSIGAKKRIRDLIGLKSLFGKMKTVIFDFDGTLVNSMEAFADIAAQVMPKYYNITPQKSRAQYLKTSGIPFFQQLETLFPGNPNNSAAAEEFETIKKKSYLDRPVYDDAIQLLDDLRSNSIKVVVSSNNFQDLVQQYVDHKGLKFDMVLGYRDGFAKGEDHFSHIEKEYGIARKDMAFVGDSIKDGERAASSGVTFIGKEGIFSRRDFTKQFPDTPVVKSLSEVTTLFTKTRRGLEE